MPVSSPAQVTAAAPTLLIPFAGALEPAARAALASLQLPHLADLLTRLTRTDVSGTDEWAFTPPHERALAEALGLTGDDGALPWAALDSDDPSQPQAWFHPVHFQVGMDQVSLLPADGLEEAISRSLLKALQPLCEEDGVTLEFCTPQRWRARGARLAELSCASLDRVSGRSVAAWQPRGPQAPWLRRLQSEAQMLFYTHPANDALEAAGLAPVNGFWADGPGAVAHTAPIHPPIRCNDSLRLPALQGDVQAWVRAWNVLDSTELADLAERARRGESIRLILCGERRAAEFTSGPRSWLDRWRQRLRRSEHPASLLESL